MNSTEQLLAELTAYSARHNGTAPFCPTVVRIARNGDVCLMNRQDGGWMRSSYTYRSLWSLARAWRLRFDAFGQDEHSTFVRVSPLRSDYHLSTSITLATDQR